MGFNKKTVKNLPLDKTTVLVRADYNVPLKPDGTIADDYRIRQSLPTLKYLLSRHCTLVLCAHLGRPDGRVKKEFSLEPVARRLEELLGVPVVFVPACVGDQVVQAAKAAKPGTVVLLENLRFHAEEEADDREFARRLARDSRARYFVQDGFGVVHRAHASTAAITEFLPSVAGLLLQKEVTTITGAMQAPEHPLVAVLGGAKISDKIGVIERFIDIADTLIIGGAMANTFLAFGHKPIGKSKVEPGLEGTIQSIYDRARAKIGPDGDMDNFIVLPSDVAVADRIDAAAKRRDAGVWDVQPDDIILDIGMESIGRAAEAVKGARTVVWNGTMGYAELEQFSYGSARIALELAQNDAITSIIGGGDTADFALHWDVRQGGSFSHISTGGGASLELMAGQPMPGIESLLDA